MYTANKLSKTLQYEVMYEHNITTWNFSGMYHFCKITYNSSWISNNKRIYLEIGSLALNHNENKHT